MIVSFPMVAGSVSVEVVGLGVIPLVTLTTTPQHHFCRTRCLYACYGEREREREKKKRKKMKKKVYDSFLMVAGSVSVEVVGLGVIPLVTLTTTPLLQDTPSVCLLWRKYKIKERKKERSLRC